MYPDTGSISPIPLKPGSGRTRCHVGSTRLLATASPIPLKPGSGPTRCDAGSTRLLATASPIPLQPDSGRTRCDTGNTRSLVPLLLVYTLRVDLSSPRIRRSTAARCSHAFCVASSLYIPRRFKLIACPLLSSFLLARLLRGFPACTLRIVISSSACKPLGRFLLARLLRGPPLVYIPPA